MALNGDPISAFSHGSIKFDESHLLVFNCFSISKQLLIKSYKVLIGVHSQNWHQMSAFFGNRMKLDYLIKYVVTDYYNDKFKPIPRWILVYRCAQHWISDSCIAAILGSILKTTAVLKRIEYHFDRILMSVHCTPVAITKYESTMIIASSSNSMWVFATCMYLHIQISIQAKKHYCDILLNHSTWLHFRVNSHDQNRLETTQF